MGCAASKPAEASPVPAAMTKTDDAPVAAGGAAAATIGPHLVPDVLKSNRSPLYTLPADMPAAEAGTMPNLVIEGAPVLDPPTPWKLNYTCFYKLKDIRKCALLVDDVQEEYRKFFPDGFLPPCVKTVDAARAAGIPIIYSHWSRMAPDDGYYGALDEWYGPYGHSFDNPMMKTNPMYMGTNEGNTIIPEVAPNGSHTARTLYHCLRALFSLLAVHCACYRWHRRRAIRSSRRSTSTASPTTTPMASRFSRST